MEANRTEQSFCKKEAVDDDYDGNKANDERKPFKMNVYLKSLLRKRKHVSKAVGTSALNNIEPHVCLFVFFLFHQVHL